MLVNLSWSQDIEVEASVSRAEIFIGDRFEYKIIVRYDDTGSVDLPGLVGNLGSFEVSDFANSDVIKKDDKRSQTWTLTLSTFITGDFVLPPQLVEYTINPEAKPLRFFTDPVQVKVLSRNTGEEEDILDVEGPMKDSTIPKYYWMIFGALVLIILIVIGVILWKRRKKKEIPRLPPYEEAVLAFKDLKLRKYLEDELQREHFFKLTEIIKTYLHRRYKNLDALDATSSELLERLGNHAVLSEDQFEDLKKFCDRGDLVKFASMNLEIDECQEITKSMEVLVDATKPLEKIEKNEEEKS